MSTTTETSRRSFLKSGALVAAPIAAVGMPVAALAEDGSKAKLARLEDERTISGLHAELLRQINGAGDKFPKLAAGLRHVAPDAAPVQDLLTFSDDGNRASARQPVTVEIASELEGDETLVQMARLQGNAADIRSESRVLIAEYVRREGAWSVAKVALA
jgi:hypothetical protein